MPTIKYLDKRVIGFDATKITLVFINLAAKRKNIIQATSFEPKVDNFVERAIFINIMGKKFNFKDAKKSKAGGLGGLWFGGFLGALIYFINHHSGTFWLVILAILKALVWPVYLVYNLFVFLRVR